MLHLFRQRAETVDQLGAETVDLLGGLKVAEAAVERQPELQVRHIAFRDHHGGADGDLRRPAGVGHLAAVLHLGHRLLQHLLVEFEADLLDVAGLLFAEQIAGAADVEVVAGELEAGAERVQRLQHLQAAVGGVGQLLVRGQREQRIGAHLGAADTAPELVELRQAEHVGPVHDQRVGGRDVEAGFHDGGGEQHVVLAIVEGVHDVVEFAGRHLAVGDGHLQFRHLSLEEILDFRQIRNARHDVERMAAAITLAQQRLADDQRVEGRDESAHRHAVDRRRGDQRQFAHPGQRQLQRARNGRRRQRQHMHIALQFLQAFLVLDAEMLLLVDDQKTEALEGDCRAEQRMGANDDVDGAVGDALLGLGQFLGADQPRGLAHLDRQAGEALREGLEMLARQKRGRHHHRHLETFHGGDEGGAQRHLGLAEADVAADEAIHRAAGGQILGDGVDGRLLVVGLLIGEARGELVIEPVGRNHGGRGAHLALGGDADQLASHVEQAALQLRLARLPGAAAQLVERGFRRIRAVARQKLDVLDRQEQPVVAGIADFEAVVRGAGGLDGLQADEAADAVVGMDDDIAMRQRSGLGDEIGGALLALGAPHQAVAQNVLLRDDDERVGLEAGLQRQHGESRLARRQFFNLGQRRDRLEIAEMMFGQDLAETVERAFGPAGDDDAAFGGAFLGDVLDRHVEDIGVGVGTLLGERAAGARAGVEYLAAAGVRRVERRELDRLAFAGRGLHIVGRQIHQPRRHRLIGNRVLQRRVGLLAACLVVIDDQVVPLAQRFVRKVIEHHRRVWQVVEDRFQPLVEERQPVLHAGETTSLRDRRVKPVVARRGAESFDVGTAEAADGFRRQRHLAHRLQRHRLALAAGALAGDIEAADRFQRVAEEIEAQPFAPARRVEVKNTAANREFADIAHRRHALEAGILQPRDQLVHVDLVAGTGMEGLGFQQFGRRHALQQGVDGGEHDGTVRFARQSNHRRQCIQPARGGVGAGRDAIIGQTVPGRQFEHRQAGRGEGKRLDDGRQALTVAGHEQHRAVGRDLARRLHQREGLEAVDDKGSSAALRQTDFGDQNHGRFNVGLRIRSFGATPGSFAGSAIRYRPAPARHRSARASAPYRRFRGAFHIGQSRRRSRRRSRAPRSCRESGPPQACRDARNGTEVSCGAGPDARSSALHSMLSLRSWWRRPSLAGAI